MERIFVVFAALLLMSGLFALMEALFAGNRQPRWKDRRGLRTDVVYWFMTPLLTSVLGNAGIVVILVLAYQLAPTELQAMLNSRETLLGSQPLWLQAFAILLIGDFIGYWVHRAFHWGPLWRIHVVHHSSEDLDWLSALRFHPTNDWLARWAQGCALILVGFTPIMVAAYIPFLSLYTVFLHANVSWDFGPLRGILASPRFHRWHHSREPEGRNRNFARLLPIFDILFGTWYMPKGEVPQHFGLRDETVPESYVAQLLYPFRRRVAEVAKPPVAP